MLPRSSLTAALFIAAAAPALAEGDWTYKIMPYAQAPNIDGDASLGRLEDLGVGVNPADIIEVLDLGLMLYGEALHSSGWGVTLDYGFMDLSDDGSFAGGAGRADATVFQGTLTGSVFRRVLAEPDRSLDIYGGFRWWTTVIDVDASLGPVSGGDHISEDWVDPLIGARYIQRLGNSDWSMFALGDVGGFGVGSDFAWTAQLGASWQMRDGFALEFSYKAVGTDYETGRKGTPGYFEYDTVTHGPLFGLAFTF